MILVGLGSNLSSAEFGPPQAILAAALAALPALHVDVAARSSWYRCEPVPRSEQPWFVNGVAALVTALDPAALLAQLLALEARFGRVRGTRNAARVLDLDLLDYSGAVIEGEALVLPHPRLHQRRFVLVPLAELAPAWRHPLLGQTADKLLAPLPAGEAVCRLIG
jgi:2-amino-4-hydroxy-6-hydroxymethyldihydropteridine diphosphokinase